MQTNATSADRAAAIAISIHAQIIAQRLDAYLRDLAEQEVPWFLVLYTNPRASFVGPVSHEIRVKMVDEILTRWREDPPRFRRGTASRIYKSLASEIHEILEFIKFVTTATAGQTIPFSLFIHDFGHPVLYGANANRDDAKLALQELLDCWKAGMPDVLAHEVM